MLTHYTNTMEAVVNILNHGFAWVPNPRKLAKTLLPQRDWSTREPQQFGMISFTQLLPQQASTHREKYGSFGIVVKYAWAEQNQAQRVIYLSEWGPLFEAARKLYDIGYRDLQSRIEYPDDAAWRMSFENKSMASFVAGAALWAELLTLWEYLEPEVSSPECEWRIVNPLPDYSLVGTKTEIISTVSPPLNWAKHTRVVAANVDDIEAFVCPSSQVLVFLKRVPEEFSHVPIIEYEG